MKHILDSSFKYVPSYDTDIRKTFERVRIELNAKREQEEKNKREAQQKTITMRRA